MVGGSDDGETWSTALAFGTRGTDATALSFGNTAGARKFGFTGATALSVGNIALLDGAGTRKFGCTDATALSVADTALLDDAGTRRFGCTDATALSIGNAAWSDCAGTRKFGWSVMLLSGSWTPGMPTESKLTPSASKFMPSNPLNSSLGKAQARHSSGAM